MLHSTKAIVLHSFKYGDSGIIARVYTRNMGLQSYLVQGVRKRKSKIRANLFHPLSLVDMVVYHKEKTRLQRIKEISSASPLNNLGSDIRKSSIAIFISEMLLNVFKLQETQVDVFDFVYDAVEKLNTMTENLAGFHLLFLLQLSGFLGFSPAKNYSQNNCFFNLREGIYQSIDHGSEYCLGKEESFWLFQLSQMDVLNDLHSNITPEYRKKLLLKTIEYYRIHMEGFKEIKSLDILESVFKG